MKHPSFLIVPDSFKDCMTAKEVGENLALGIRNVFKKSEIEIIPMADGGEGTVESIISVLGGEIVKQKVHDPLGRITTSFFGILSKSKTAVIEMAAASGLEKLELSERNPWITSSYGTGELIKAALDKGCDKIIVGLGGSATNDAGTGMVKALGIRFLDADNKELPEGGGYLDKLKIIDMSGLDKRIARTKIIAATDVTSVLLGKQGASHVFGPQKGATPQMVQKLEQNLVHFAQIVNSQIKVSITEIKGGGAAGGLGAGLYVFLNAQINSGFATIAKLINIEEKIKTHSLIITAEGKADDQTISGKTPAGVGLIAKNYNKPVFLFTGNASDTTQSLYSIGITSVVPITRKPVSLQEALSYAALWLQKSAEEFCRILKAGSNLGL